VLARGEVVLEIKTASRRRCAERRNPPVGLRDETTAAAIGIATFTADLCNAIALNTKSPADGA